MLLSGSEIQAAFPVLHIAFCFSECGFLFVPANRTGLLLWRNVAITKTNPTNLSSKK